MLSAPHPMNTSKIQLHVEQLWKQPRDYKKSSSTTKAVKKEPHKTRSEGRRSNQLGTHAPRKGYRRGEAYDVLREWVVQSTYRALQTWGLTQGKLFSLTGLKISDNWPGAVRNQGYTLARAHACSFLGIM